MTVTATNASSGPFAPNGSTTIFPFTFAALSAGEVKVVRRDDDGVDTVQTGYTVTLTPGTDGGSVTFDVAPSGTDVLYILSDPDFDQQLNIANQGAFAPTALNDAFDRAAIRDIKLRDQVDILTDGLAVEVSTRTDADETLTANVAANSNAIADNAAAIAAETAERDLADAAILAALSGTVLTNATLPAANRTLLAATSHVALVPAFLTESGFQGLFVPSNANLSAEVTADPDKIATVPYSTDATGASGGWQRKPVYNGRLSKLFAAALALGTIALPGVFNNQLAAEPYYDGSAVQYKVNPYDLIDWTRSVKGTITFTGQPSNGDTITINNKVYTFETVLTNVDGHVFIGATTAATVTNLINAIIRTGSTNHGVAGTSFAALTSRNWTVNAYQGAGTTITLSLKPAGTLMILSEAATNVTISSDINLLYQSFATGSDANAGTSSTAAWKTINYAIDNAPDRSIIFTLDDIEGVNSQTTDAVHPFSGLLKIVSGAPSGRTAFTSMDENIGSAQWAFAPSGGAGAYVSTLASRVVYGSRAQFDARYTDSKGIPRPITVAASIAACQATPGTFFYDAGTTSLYVHMWDGRIPDPNDGWLYAYGATSHFQLQQGLTTSAGVILCENLDFCFNNGVANTVHAFTYRPVATGSSNSARFGMRNCRFYGSSGAGLKSYDGSITCIDNCHARYNYVDALNYESFVTTGTKGAFITIYETNCSAYDSGFTGWSGQAALNTSCNGSTAHSGIRVLRSGLRAANCNGAVVADVNGVLSVNLDVQASQPTGTANPKACFWHSGVAAGGATSGMYLLGCSANDNDDATVTLLTSNGTANGEANGQIYNKQWRGQTVGLVDGGLKDWMGIAA